MREAVSLVRVSRRVAKDVEFNATQAISAVLTMAIATTTSMSVKALGLDERVLEEIRSVRNQDNIDSNL
jgi:hypothetical protein